MPAVAEDPGPAAGRVHYRFGPLEQRGLIAGWRGGQIAVVAAGLVLGVFALRSTPSVGGAAGAFTCAAIGVVVAWWPVGGRTGEQWLPLVFRWAVVAAAGGRLQLADGPRSGHLVRSTRVDGDPGEPDAPRRLVIEAARGRRPRPGSGPPGAFAGLQIGTVPTGPAPGDPSAGVVLDQRARTVTAVLAVRGHSFALASPSDQDGRIAGWARVLSSMAREGTDIHRVQWIESCLPDDGAGVRTHLRDRAVLAPGDRAVRSYQALLDHSMPVTRRHQVLIGVSVHRGRAARAIRASGGGEVGAGAVVLREAVALQRQLREADLAVEGILGPAALASVICEATAPCSALGSPGPDAAEPHPRGHPPSVGLPGPGAWAGEGTRHPWPMAVDPSWELVRTDATWHVTYWIAEWPRVDVTPDFLGPLLFSPVRRSLTLVMEPVSPSRAARQVAQARTADIADGELRRRGGFLVTARQTREREEVEHRDVELADGHAQYRFSGYVTVTADSAAELAEACTLVEQAAGQARLELRRLYGEQDVALTCTFPLGRGLA